MGREASGRQLRIGVLGCAEIAWRRTLPAFLRAGVEVTALASREEAKARRFADRFGGTAIAGYERLVDRPDVDAIYIALPTGLHHAWARRALEAGKHVLVEKPLTCTLADAEDLAALAGQHGLLITDNFGFTYHAQHAAVQKLIASGVIGVPQVFRCAFGIPARPLGDIRYQPELGGGALLDLGVYGVRAVRLLFGEDLTVAGSVLRLDSEGGIDLGGNALLYSADGIPAELSFNFQVSYQSSYTIWGSEGQLTVGRAFTPPEAFRPPARLERQGGVEEVTLDPDDQFANLMRDFARSALGGADFESCSRALLRQAALVDEIRRVACRVPARRIASR